MTANRKATPTPPEHLPPLTNEDGEVRELTTEDFKSFQPSSAFPELVGAFQRARGQRGPQKSPTKERVALRLDSAIVDHFRSGGPGWQTRINDALAALIRKNERP